jgi:hypothetical protein
MKMISRERLPEHPEQFYKAATGPEGPVDLRNRAHSSSTSRRWFASSLKWS